MKKTALISTILICTFSFILNGANISTVIIDTSNNESYKYQTFLTLANSAGFKIDYKGISESLDSTYSDLKLNKYDALFFIIGVDFLKGIATRSLVSIKFLNILKQFASQKNKIIALFLPPLSNKKIKNNTSLFAPLFNCLNIGVSTNGFFENQQIVNPEAFRIINNFLNSPLETRHSGYHTTLSSPDKKGIHLVKPIRNETIATLPIKQIQTSIAIRNSLPYGVYWFKNNQHILISSSSLLSFSGISENFHICPVSFNMRMQMHKNILLMMSELKTLFQNQTDQIDYKKILNSKMIKLPNEIKKIGKPVKNNSNHYFKKIAWTDINVFEKTDLDAIKKQHRLIESIIKSGEGLKLWITLNPQMYYSPIAKNKKNITIFKQSLKKFTALLAKESKKTKTKPTQIIIGFEIANNLYPPNYPKNCAYDIYGNKYFDIPNPIDFKFWEEEIIKPFNQFMSEWEKPEINNGIEILGIVIDLEMYCRKTSSAFLATTGFNNTNIQEFGKSNIYNVIKTAETQKYFNFLENKAHNIGQKIKDAVNDKIKNGFILCYAPNISVDWFYKGFYSGLSSKEQPIQLLTFNSESRSHQKWLEKNKIFSTHSSVLMLSKIKSSKDFKWLDEKLKHNHGVWLNKFSRLSESKHGDWMAIEQSSMTEKEKIDFYKLLKTR